MFAKRRGARFSIAAVLVCVLTGWFGPPAHGQTNPITNGTISVKLHTVATLPTGTTGAPDFLTTDGVAGDARLFVLGQRGQIRIVNNGSLNSTPFLDVNTALSGMFISPPSLSDERGLLGLAFSPDFANSGTPGFHKVYTFTSEDWSASSVGPTFANPELGAGNGPSGTTESVIREWTVSSTNPNVIDTSLGSRVLFRLRKPQTNHNGGTLTFGPDKYLYITTGDGGGGNDNNGSPTSTTDGHSNSVNGGPPGNAQDITQIYGKILRIKPTTDADLNTTLDAPTVNIAFPIATRSRRRETPDWTRFMRMGYEIRIVSASIAPPENCTRPMSVNRREKRSTRSSTAAITAGYCAKGHWRTPTSAARIRPRQI